MKTALCLASGAICCLATLAIVTSSPTAVTTIQDSTTVTDDTTAIPQDNSVGEINGTRLVITKVVKTVEFVVGLEEDDGENSTEYSEDSTTPLIETEIKVLNPDLLAQVVEAQQALGTASPSSMDGTKQNDDS